MTHSASLVHDAFFFETDDRFVAALAPWLADGARDGTTVAVATTPDRIALLRDALGQDGRGVSFFPNDDWYRRPASTIANWQRALEASSGSPVPARVLGEVVFGETPEDHVRWTRYESALNRAFEDASAWIVCPYDVRRLPASIVEDAWRTHPTVWNGDRAESDRYLAPAELFEQVPERLPALPPRPFQELPPHLDLRALRKLVGGAGRRAGLAPERVDELVLAFAEVSANATVHGGGIERATLWLVEDSLVCEVRDRAGRLSDQLAGFVPPTHEAFGGRGLWLARQLSTWLVIRSDRDGGTTITFAVDRA